MTKFLIAALCAVVSLCAQVVQPPGGGGGQGGVISARSGETCWMGDSITIYNGTTSLFGTSYPDQVQILSRQQVFMSSPAENWGVSGNTTTQMLARLPALLATNPACNYVTINGGTNDVASISTATSISNISAMAVAIKASGRLPILSTVTPKTSFVTQVQALNQAIRNLANSSAMPLVDYYSVLVDPAGSGVYQAIYSTGDGTHPNPYGQWAMANKFITDAGPYYPQGGVFLPTATSDGLTFNVNPLMQSCSGNVPASWTVSGTSPTSQACAAATAPALGQTWTQVFTGSGSSAATTVGQNGVSSTSGHLYLTMGRISIAGLNAINSGLASQTPIASLSFQSASGTNRIFNYGSDVANGIFAYEWISAGESVVPAYNVNYGTSTTAITVATSQVETIDLTAGGYSASAPWSVGGITANTQGGGAPTGACGGDTAGTYPNCTVTNLSNVANASLGTTGIASAAVTSAKLANNLAIPGSPTTTTQSQNDNSTKVSTTAYTDLAVSNAIAGVNPAIAAKYATVAAGDTSGLTYASGASGVGSTMTGANNTATTIDGHAFVIGDVSVTRLLIKNDTQSPSGAFNGVYLFTALHTSITGDIFTRALDYDQPSDINSTGAIPVQAGTANATTSWLLTSAVTTVGTDPLVYVKFSVNPSASIITITTGTTATLSTAYTINQEATAGTAVAYTLPTAFAATATSGQFCVSNGNNGSAADTGILTVSTSVSGQFIVFTDGTLSATGGNVTSPGAAADAACFVGIDATHWMMYVRSGVWVKH